MRFVQSKIAAAVSISLISSDFPSMKFTGSGSCFATKLTIGCKEDIRYINIHG